MNVWLASPRVLEAAVLTLTAHTNAFHVSLDSLRTDMEIVLVRMRSSEL